MRLGGCSGNCVLTRGSAPHPRTLHPRLARVLDAGWKGMYAVEVINKQRAKEKEMWKSPPKSTPSKGKGKDNDKDSKGGETAAK